MSESPDGVAIQAFLHTLFDPAHDIYPEGLLELRTLHEKYGVSCSYFTTDEQGIHSAAQYAAGRNLDGYNVCVGVNPRRRDVDREGGGSNKDVPFAIWNFADLDDAAAVAQIEARTAHAPATMRVTTGTVPHRRDHLYWRLDEPVGNLKAWEEQQRALVTLLDADKAVVDPARIMRVAGTVSYPSSKKISRGYIEERVSVDKPHSDLDSSMSPEALRGAYFAPVGHSQAAPTKDYTGSVPSSSPQPLLLLGQPDVQALINDCLRDDHWHNAMITFVAKMVARGHNDDSIMSLAESITLPGYTIADTVREMQSALRGARAKYDPALRSEIADTERQMVSPVASQDALATVDAFAFDENALPTRPWIVPGVMLAGYTHIIAAPGGSGKSLLTLQMAIMLASGRPWGQWSPKRRVKTLILNSEDDLDEQRRRLAAAVRVMDVTWDELRGYIHLVSDTEDMLIARDMGYGKIVRAPLVDRMRAYIEEHDISVVFADPLAETFEGDENDNSQVKWAMKIWRNDIAQPTGAAVILSHHTSKGVASRSGAGNADIIRGAGAIVNSTRISATLMTMTEEEATDLGIPLPERQRYVRYDDAKANQMLLSGNPVWFRKESVQLTNGCMGSGDSVGALVPWEAPNPYADVSTDTLYRCLTKISEGLVDDDGGPTGVRYTLRAGNTWAGQVLIEETGLSEAAVKKLLYSWKQNQVLREEKYHNAATGHRHRSGVFVDMDAAEKIRGG